MVPQVLQIPIERRLAALRRLPNHLRLAAIAEALPIAPPAQKRLLAVELSELSLLPDGWVQWAQARKDPLALALRPLAHRRAELSNRALRTLVATWGGLPGDVREGVLGAGRGRWSAVTREVAVRAIDREVIGAAKLVRDLGDATLADVPAAILRSSASARAKAAAEQAILRLCAAAARRPGLPAPPPLEIAVRAALDGWDAHRRRGVLLGALLLLHPAALTRAGASGPLGRWLSGEEGPAHRSLRSLIRRSDEPLVRMRAFEWVARDGLGAACLDRLDAARSPADHEVVLARTHLLLRPARARRIRMIKASVTSLPRQPDALIEAARCGLATWITAIGGRADAKAGARQALLRDPRPAVRHAALRSLPTGELGPLCLDPDARVARSAFLRWSIAGAERGKPSPELAAARRSIEQRLSASPHAAVRAWTEEESPQALDAGRTAPRLAARRRLASDREGLLDELRSAIRSQDRRAVAMARALGLCSALAETIAEGSLATDARFASACASALGDVESESAEAPLLRALHTGEARVASNALESIERQQRRGRARLACGFIEFRDETRHRLRASALRILAVRGEDAVALDGLAAMLSDDRPQHRLAGAWLAERLVRPALSPSRVRRWNDLSVRVGELARTDVDPAVRARAGRCARRMLAHMRMVWETRGGFEP